MTQEPPNNGDDVELQLAQRIIEMSKIIENNVAQIEELKLEQDQRKETVDNWNSRLKEWEINLENRFSDINQKLSTLIDNFEDNKQTATEMSEEIKKSVQEIQNNHNLANDELKNMIQQQETNQTLANDELKNTIQQQETNQTLANDELKNMIQQQETNQTLANDELKNTIQQQETNQTLANDELKNMIQQQETNQTQINDKYKNDIEDRITSEKFINSIDEINEKLNDKSSLLEQSIEHIKTELKTNSDKSQNNFETIANTVEMLGEGLEKLGIHGDNQGKTIEELINSFNQFKQNLKEVISKSKDDQISQFENFSRIIESYNENIRTEIALTAQFLKESDTQILDETSISFMSKKKGEELEKSVTSLSEELRIEASKTRDELVQGLKESVEEYDKTMEQQNIRIQNYQSELKKYQEEIQAVIDRKVNEKYEVVFLLLAKAAVQTEELALLIKTSEIYIPSPALTFDESNKKTDG